MDLWVQRIHAVLREHFRRAGSGSIRRTERALGIAHGSFRKWRLRGRLDVRMLGRALAELGVDRTNFWLEVGGSGVDPVSVARRPNGPPKDPVVRRAVARWESPEPGPSVRLDEEELLQLDGLRDRDPKLGVRRAKAALKKADKRQLPRLLAIYGSGRRVQAQIDQALEALQWALAIAEHGGASLSRHANILQRMGVAFAYRGDHYLALLFAREAAHEYEIAGNLRGRGRSLVDQGTRYAHLNQPEKAIGLFEAALRCLPEDEMSNRFGACHALAVLHQRQENLREALNWVRRAEELASEVPPGVFALLLATKAEIATAGGDHAEAERCYARELEIYRSLSPIDAALASVDLVRSQFLGGRVAAGFETIKGMLEFLGPLEKNPVASRAIVDLVQLVLSGQKITLRVLDRVAHTIEKGRGRHDRRPRRRA